MCLLFGAERGVDRALLDEKLKLLKTASLLKCFLICTCAHIHTQRKRKKSTKGRWIGTVFSLKDVEKLEYISIPPHMKWKHCALKHDFYLWFKHMRCTDPSSNVGEDGDGFYVNLEWRLLLVFIVNSTNSRITWQESQ